MPLIGKSLLLPPLLTGYVIRQKRVQHVKASVPRRGLRATLQGPRPLSAGVAHPMNNSLRGSVVITGASTGIGAACALHLDQLGFQVFAGVRTERDGRALQSHASARRIPIMLDVTQEDSILSARDGVGARVGVGGPIRVGQQRRLCVGWPAGVAVDDGSPETIGNQCHWTSGRQLHISSIAAASTWAYRKHGLDCRPGCHAFSWGLL